MKAEMERLYRQQTFLLELSQEVEQPQPSPYEWLPRQFWPRQEEPTESPEERRASLMMLYPEDVLTSCDEEEQAQELQIRELRDLARVKNGACQVDFQVTYNEADYSGDSADTGYYSAIEELSDQAWADIDPNDPQSLSAQAFAEGYFTPEDAAELKAQIQAEVSEWQGDETLAGEIEYLSAAGHMARLAHERGVPELEERCRDYIGYRTEYLGALGLL